MNTRRTNRFALTFLVLGLATTAVAAVGSGDTREHDVTKVMHRTVDIDGFEIFYREVGPMTRRPSCCCMGFRRRRACSET